MLGRVDKPTLTFTDGNWNVAQTVTVSAPIDHLVTGPHTGAITHQVTSSDPNYDGRSVPRVTVNIADVDVAPILVTPTTGLVTTENGGTAKFSVQLVSLPDAGVTIDIASSDDTAGTVSNTSLTFTTANWNVPQIVTITGVDDFIAGGNRTYNIAFTQAVDAEGNPENVTVTNLAYVSTTRTWTGAVGNAWTTPGNWLGGVVPHPSDSLVFPAGPNNFSFNDFPENTRFTSLTFQNTADFLLIGNPLVLDPHGGIALLNNGPGFTKIGLPIVLGSDTGNLSITGSEELILINGQNYTGNITL